MLSNKYIIYMANINKINYVAFLAFTLNGVFDIYVLIAEQILLYMFPSPIIIGAYLMTNNNLL